MYFTYIIRSKSTKKFYTGITNDPDRRLKEHNRVLSKNVGTRGLTDFEYVFLEQVESRNKARKKEKYLKSGSGREFRNKIVK